MDKYLLNVLRIIFSRTEIHSDDDDDNNDYNDEIQFREKKHESERVRNTQHIYVRYEGRKRNIYEIESEFLVANLQL